MEFHRSEFLTAVSPTQIVENVDSVDVVPNVKGQVFLVHQQPDLFWPDIVDQVDQTFVHPRDHPNVRSLGLVPEEPAPHLDQIFRSHCQHIQHSFVLLRCYLFASADMFKPFVYREVRQETLDIVLQFLVYNFVVLDLPRIREVEERVESKVGLEESDSQRPYIDFLRVLFISLKKQYLW